MYLLSADFGTSSVKVAVLNEYLQIQEMAKREYAYRVRDTDKIEILVEELEDAFFGALSDLKEYLPCISAVSFDTFAPSLVWMDKEGEALYPIVTHMDRRSREYTAKILNVITKEEFLNITGTLPHCGGVTLTTLLWFQEHRPDIFQGAGKIGHLSTYLFKKMTGQWAMDTVNASITGMYETTIHGGWSGKICRRFQIPMDLLPNLCPAGTAWAPLLPSWAGKMGIPPGVPVLLGMQDVTSALIGAGVRRKGQALCISGSSEMISVLTDKPVVNPDYYLRESGIQGLWQMFAITAGGFALEWFRKEFYREMPRDYFFERHLEAILMKNFDARGVTFLPYLAGDRQSLRRKKGGFHGLTLDTRRDDLLCALLKGIQLPSKKVLELCAREVAVDPNMKATGNMAENRAYLNSKKEILDLDSIQVIENCPLKGNAKMALKLLRRLEKTG